MFLPDKEKFKKDMAVYRLIPVCTEIVVDLDTPLTLFSKVAEGNSHVFLFESMEGGEKWGRFSFIGYDPLVTFSSKNDSITLAEIKKGIKEARSFSSDPLQALKSLIEELGAAEYDHLPRFCGGAVGFLGYDMVRFMEELPDSRPATDFPDSAFMVPKIVLVHDSFKQTVTIVCWVQANESDGEKLYHDTVQLIESVVAKIKRPVSSEFFDASHNDSSVQHVFTSNMAKEQFEDMVERAKEYIRAGDIIQVVLSQRFHTETNLSPLVLYRALRHINPSPYLFYLQLGEVIQIGSSPEILVRKEDKNIELRPIAGTRRRQKFKSPELDVIQDADRLDAMGAIGIARTFSYGGHKNREIYNPDVPPNMSMTKEEYKNSTAPSLNHFYEKLLLLKDRMNTATGKELAKHRHKYMEDFLDEFYKEWNGEM